MRGRALALGALALGAAFAAGWSLGRQVRPPAAPSAYEIREGRQDYLNPLLECEVTGAELPSFDAELADLGASLESRPGVRKIGIYFRALNNGMWAGYNEREGFIPASLAKVPVVLACLRQAEASPAFLARTVRYEGLPEEREPGFMNPEVNLERGRSYTVAELVRRVGAYSDNAAARLLASLVDPAVLAAVNADLGLPDAGPSGGGRHISPREYGAVFRVLYNGSYVGRSLSRLALESFAESTFELGLVAGVPPGTLVAHKFGVWEGDDPPGPLQLHDCGIVYHRENPYLLCVMTGGENYVQMAEAIAAAARFVHGRVEAGSARELSRGG